MMNQTADTSNEYEYGHFITAEDRIAAIRKAEQALKALNLWAEMSQQVWEIVSHAVDDLIDDKPCIERITSKGETQYSEYHTPAWTPIDELKREFGVEDPPDDFTG